VVRSARLSPLMPAGSILINGDLIENALMRLGPSTPPLMWKELVNTLGSWQGGLG
jgi:hypothetical protein